MFPLGLDTATEINYDISDPFIFTTTVAEFGWIQLWHKSC